MYLERLMKNEERERVARIIMEKMSIEQLSDLMSLYQMMGRKCSEELEKKLQDLIKRRKLNFNLIWFNEDMLVKRSIC